VCAAASKATQACVRGWVGACLADQVMMMIRQATCVHHASHHRSLRYSSGCGRWWVRQRSSLQSV
jgi:hypothetical protein